LLTKRRSLLQAEGIVDDGWGWIKPGQRADLVLSEENPWKNPGRCGNPPS
jgi:predicted amidohydrolase YtcJ